ncbi:MAG: sigma-E processing peptidase SpoIIGA [Clostridia bacterium]|nr:sigma-E processing peptidase SpoIIGA [Clostridia bacterium]
MYLFDNKGNYSHSFVCYTCVMKVYIEAVILDNLILTASIAILSYSACAKSVRKLRTLIVSVVGTVISVTYPFWDLSLVLTLIARIAVGIMLSLILFAGLDRLVLSTLVFFGQTALIGGACIFVNYLIVGDFATALVSAPVLPYSVPSVIGVGITFIIKIIYRASWRKRTESAFIYNVRLTIGGVTAEMQGYLDSGNFLFDEKTELPIVVIKLSSLSKAFGKANVIKRISGAKTAISVGNTSTQLFLLKPDKFILYSGKKMNTYSDVMLGIVESGFNRREDMLLHPSIIGG